MHLKIFHFDRNIQFIPAAGLTLKIPSVTIQNAMSVKTYSASFDLMHCCAVVLHRSLVTLFTSVHMKSFISRGICFNIVNPEGPCVHLTFFSFRSGYMVYARRVSIKNPTCDYSKCNVSKK